MTGSKAEARAFLDRLSDEMQRQLPPWHQLQHEIPDVVIEAKTRADWKHKRTPEDAFLHHYAFPILFQLISDELGDSADGARGSLLTEFVRCMPDMASGSPARAMRYAHPFEKIIVEPEEIMKRWKGEKGRAKLHQPCPDFALGSPFPHRIVFEGKYFIQKGPAAGERHLVASAYQAFYYGAQTPADANSSGVPWRYDYACLFACDVSDEGNLISAWRSLDDDVRNGFWEGANIYVMILRPGAENEDRS